VASEAVFVDTLGRYQSENPTDVQEWLSLLETIKKHRPERPIDGMIVSVSVEKLMLSDEKQIEEQAKILRVRIDEAMKAAGVRFPVYLVFTHADAIEGFRDSFSASQKEGQKLVWGTTIPLDKNNEVINLFDTEFDLLQASVIKRRLFRLSAPFPPIRQLRIFNFPLHFASVKRRVGHFITTLLRPNPFSENPLFRGFYFTAVPANRPNSPAGEKTLASIPYVVGETYFTERLFREVILRDKDLVATILAQRQKPPVLRWVLSGLALFLMALFLILSAHSLYRNKVLLDSATREGEKVLEVYKADAGRDLFAKNPDEVLFEMTAIENLRKRLVELDDYERNGAPWWMRFGLYSGNRIYRERLLNIYFNAIEQRFKKPVVRKLEEDLQKFSAGQAVTASNLTAQQEDLLGKHYDLLKAYLMLSGKEEYRKYAESSFLIATLSDYWKKESKVGEGLWLLAEQQLEFWAKQV
ncbi:MAG: type VI secretion protein IcmF/TssM N-terminal domain-containing protein, partial [Pyrinomonadaceae bacterium]